jgi:hypothetical protein
LHKEHVDQITIPSKEGRRAEFHLYILSFHPIFLPIPIPMVTCRK